MTGAAGTITGFFFFLARQTRPATRNATKKADPNETHTMMIVVWWPPEGGATTSDEGGEAGGVTP